jgi:hypothetical protein
MFDAIPQRGDEAETRYDDTAHAFALQLRKPDSETIMAAGRLR